MPRTSRQHSDTGVYHVMLRGIDRQDIFADDQDRDKLHQKNRPYFHSYYHSDHLGSSMLITDESGNVTQQLDYLPYGEVFLEKRSQDQDVDFFTPYKFNGKELDEETGLYYYGARYMNPRLSIWYATDPMQEKYPNLSSYSYCAGNPIGFHDSDGEAIQMIDNRKDGAFYIAKIAATTLGRCVLDKLIGNEFSKVYRIQTTFFTNASKWDPEDNLTVKYAKDVWSPALFTDFVKMTPFTILAHEIFHAYDFDRGFLGYINSKQKTIEGEEHAVSFENMIRGSYGLDFREHYIGLGSSKNRDFRQFPVNEIISNFKLLDAPNDKTYGFSYYESSVDNNGRKQGKPEKKFMIVSYDKNYNVTYKIYRNEHEYKNDLSNN